MLDRHKIRNWAYLLLRGQETIAEREGDKGTLRGAGGQSRRHLRNISDDTLCGGG